MEDEEVAVTTQRQESTLYGSAAVPSTLDMHCESSPGVATDSHGHTLEDGRDGQSVRAPLGLRRYVRCK